MNVNMLMLMLMLMRCGGQQHSLPALAATNNLQETRSLYHREPQTLGSYTT